MTLILQLKDPSSHLPRVGLLPGGRAPHLPPQAGRSDLCSGASTSRVCRRRLRGHVLGVLGDLRPAGRGGDVTDVGSETEASGLISGVPVVCGTPGLTSLVCFASFLSGNGKWESEARRGDREKPPRRGAAGCVQGEGAGRLSVLRTVQGPSLLLMPPWAEAAAGRQKAAR